MPEKRLIAHDLQCPDGVCAIGSVGVRRGVDMSSLDPENPEGIAYTFDIAGPLVREIEFMNDEFFLGNETPEHRWHRMRQWAAEQLASSE